MKDFKNYLQTLENLDIENTLLQGKKKILLLSGSSDYKSAALSPVQKDFLSSFLESGYEMIPSNFPFHKDFRHNTFQEIPIWKASLRNIYYYFQCRFHKKFQKEIQRLLSPIQEMESVIVILQSSGLHLWKQFQKDFSGKLPQEIFLFSCGPVAPGKNKETFCKIIKGKQDIYSIFLDRHPVDIWIESNHFDYLESSTLKQYIQEEIQRERRRL